jgi:hypothetical protein
MRAMKTSFQSASIAKNPLPISRRVIDCTSIPCRVVLQGCPLGITMDATEREVRVWIEQAFGEDAVNLSIWTEEEEMVQVLFRLPDKVVISDLSWEDDVIVEESSLIINLSNWQPGSIQTRRMPDGLVRIRHRSNEIMLAARVRSAEWAGSLLEEWLMDMRGDANKPRGRQRRISDLKRRRDMVTRMLDQADLTSIKDEIATAENRLTSADDRLSGRRA